MNKQGNIFMTESDNNEWLLQIKCPYCGKVVGESIDFDELYAQYETEDEANAAGMAVKWSAEEPQPCPHTALYGEINNYGDFHIPDEWQEEMLKVAKLTAKYSEDDFDETDPEAAFELIKENLEMYDEEDDEPSPLVKALTGKYKRRGFSLRSELLGSGDEALPYFIFIFIKEHAPVKQMKKKNEAD